MLTIQQALQLRNKVFADTEVIAGKSGLHNQVDTVLILDMESIMCASQIKTFERSLFLLNAKLTTEQFSAIVKQLILENAAALILRGYTASQIPESAILLADASKFPILILGANGERFETIIVEITNLIKNFKDQDDFERKIATIVEDKLPRSLTHPFAIELASNVGRPSYAVYCLPRLSLDDVKYQENLLQLVETCKEGMSVYPYKRGYLFLAQYTEQNGKNLTDPICMRMRRCGISSDDYYIGISRQYWESMDFAIRESISAAMCAIHNDCNSFSFDTVDFYRLLVPIKDNYWVKNFCESILTQINKYDKEYNAEIFKTINEWVTQDGNIAKTAKALHIHENTVRFRIQKARSILCMEESQHFYAQIVIAMLWNRIKD